jgi:hypothetical protein
VRQQFITFDPAIAQVNDSIGMFRDVALVGNENNRVPLLMKARK